MRIALLTDLHANREALTACLAHAKQQNAGRYAFLGDLVGYGADPCWVLDTVMDYLEQGAIVVQGNHDVAVARQTRKQMHAGARIAIEWTRRQLSPEQHEFLARLPLSVEYNYCLFIHASASAPAEWVYVGNAGEAGNSLRATACRITFCGHVHIPALYFSGTGDRISEFTPVPGSGIPLGAQRRWLAIPGSVGQPRDGNPSACYAIFDDVSSELTYFRVPYDVETAACKIRDAGLPAVFAQRLIEGV